MSQTLRQVTLIGLLALVLAGLCGWSWRDMRSRRSRADAAAALLQQVEQSGERIVALRDRPMVAGSQEMELSELTQRIEEAAKTAEVPGSSLVRIWPETARRIGDTSYKEKPTQILLRNVSLKQIISFLHVLANDTTGLTVRNLRIVAPHRQVEDYTWTAEVSVTYLIFDRAEN